jgi:AcrR family transcriptional regulator
MSKAADTRNRILRAAEGVVIRDGVAHLTLEAAAQEAGVSKGGVLYHFPTRRDLVSAMVTRFTERFDADLLRYGAADSAPGSFARAYIEAEVHPATEPGASHDRRLSGALLAGVASDPDLLAPLRDRFQVWNDAFLDDGLPPGAAMVVRLAIDGMWLTDLFGLSPMSARRREELARALREMVDSLVTSGASAR